MHESEISIKRFYRKSEAAKKLSDSKTGKS